jgi:hypothetical protein
VADKATLTVAEGKKFSLHVKNNSAANKYIYKITFNGKPYTRSYIQHQDLVKGGIMDIEMGSKPSAVWGVKPADRLFNSEINSAFNTENDSLALISSEEPPIITSNSPDTEIQTLNKLRNEPMHCPPLVEVASFYQRAGGGQRVYRLTLAP